MAPELDPSLREALSARLRFYRDLGLTEFYWRPSPNGFATVEEPAERPSPAREEAISLPEGPTGAVAAVQTVGGEMSSGLGASLAATESPIASLPHLSDVSENEAIPPRKPFPAQPPVGPIIQPNEKAAALRAIQEEIGDCTRCALHKGRNKIVFADGSPDARLLFVGEGPGADEDVQGLPFVGRAGQLLNNMIAAMGLKREEVYIANVVKCRPPGNRTPEPEEAHTCSPFLFQQIDVVRPDVIVALGATAATYLMGQRQPLAGLRGRVHAFRNSKLIVTYHPAFLLRDPRQKKEAWADLQIAMRELGLKVPGRT